MSSMTFISLLYWYQEPMQWFLTKHFLKGCNLGEKLFLTTMTMINLYYHHHGKKLCQKNKQHIFSKNKNLQVKGEEGAKCHHWLHRLGRYCQVSILQQNCCIDGTVKIYRTLLSCWHHTLRERWGRNLTLSYACICHSKANLWQ